jgi:DHA1 family tetracycline resistance protein-like MFS transporter
MPVAALWGVATPAAQAMMTHHVDPSEQGRLQGAVASLSSIAGIIAPTVFTRAFAAVTGAHLHDAWAGVTFAISSAMVGLGWIIAWRTTAQLPPVSHPAPAPATIEPAVVSDADEIVVQPVPQRE